MSERFYVNCPLSVGPVVLQGPEAHHLAVVCRLRPDAQVHLFNGDGQEYLARITAADKKRVDLEVHASTAVERELPFQLTVACPLPKGDRARFLIEKLTELGVTRYVPLRTERSIVHAGEGRAGKLERYVIEACKQCGRNKLMHIGPLVSWDQFISSPQLPGSRLLAQPGGQAVASLGLKAHDTVLAVGPEGGFTEEEASRARAANWLAADLGSRVLRIETAAVSLAFLISSLPTRR